MNPVDYDRFSVVAYAPRVIVDEVDEIRRQAPPSGLPMLDAHVTVKGTFIEPTDLHLIAERARRVCQGVPPFTISVHGIRSSTGENTASVVISVEVTETLARLNRELVRELKDLCTTIYKSETEGRFAPHLTIVQQIPASELDRALAVIECYNPSYAFSVNQIALIARRGGRVWETLVDLPLDGT